MKAAWYCQYSRFLVFTEDYNFNIQSWIDIVLQNYILKSGRNSKKVLLENLSVDFTKLLYFFFILFFF